MSAADPSQTTPALDMRAVVTPEPWSLVAADYADFLADKLGRYAADAIRLADLRPGERVLDVATGPGTLALQAARITSVDALDFSRGMLDALEARAEPETRARLTLHCGDGQNLEFADDAFDAAFSMFGLFMFPDRARGFAELARVVRPGGRAVVASWQPQTDIPAFMAVIEEVRARMPADVEAPPPPLTTRASVQAEMSAAGFEVEVHGITHTIQTPSLDALWADLRRSHVALTIAEAQLDAPAFRAMLDAIRARLERDLGPGPQEIVMPAWLGVGRLPG